jgi:hypothetical protein
VRLCREKLNPRPGGCEGGAPSSRGSYKGAGPLCGSRRGELQGRAADGGRFKSPVLNFPSPHGLGELLGDHKLLLLGKLSELRELAFDGEDLSVVLVGRLPGVKEVFRRCHGRHSWIGFAEIHRRLVALGWPSQECTGRRTRSLWSVTNTNARFQVSTGSVSNKARMRLTSASRPGTRRRTSNRPWWVPGVKRRRSEKSRSWVMRKLPAACAAAQISGSSRPANPSWGTVSVSCPS